MNDPTLNLLTRWASNDEDYAHKAAAVVTYVIRSDEYDRTVSEL